MILRCTAKLLKVLRVSPASLQAVVGVEAEEECYANLLWLNRRKCVSRNACRNSVLDIRS